ncbi:DUF1801 domain-containing protein [Serinicoccus kebangsaanensis]|uniref:DUF1801 domain-containing protein n=1 Tax=Serinicoccus kebangsaanensis TaxID=2602069 RepID=UPI00124D331B|nr:DUF1801 domain-containing protein [Serinicoccus kebangsaanensis]
MGMTIAQTPGLSRPMRDALALAGFTTLADLDGQPRTAILGLHGVGKVGLTRLEGAMAAEGFSLEAGHAVWSATDRGEQPLAGSGPGTGARRAEVRTTPTGESPREWIESLPWPRRVEQGLVLLDLFEDVTGAPARMWGPSMVGFGEAHYQYATGREGDTARVGFSPREGAITLYGLQSYGSNEQLVDALGKTRLGKGCIYVNQLEDIDTAALRRLVASAWAS